MAASTRQLFRFKAASSIAQLRSPLWPCLLVWASTAHSSTSRRCHRPWRRGSRSARACSPKREPTTGSAKTPSPGISLSPMRTPACTSTRAVRPCVPWRFQRLRSTCRARRRSTTIWSACPTSPVIWARAIGSRPMTITTSNRRRSGSRSDRAKLWRAGPRFLRVRRAKCGFMS